MQTTQSDIWNASQYLRFGGERLRPAIDLMMHIAPITPATILDLGCGAGNLSAILKQRWPQAHVLGVDGSADMLERARKEAPACHFQHADIDTWTPDVKFDLIYTNATLQWLSNHRALFPRLLSFLNRGGCLAVQVPIMHDAPLRTAQVQLANSPVYVEALGQVSDRRNVLSTQAYYDLLRPLVATLDIWQTTYLHVLKGEDPVLQWASGTSLRPYLDKLSGEQLAAFRRDYADLMREAYPPRVDGSTLLPFQRMFLVMTVA